jgi:hypothetical protein
VIGSIGIARRLGLASAAVLVAACTVAPATSLDASISPTSISVSASPTATMAPRPTVVLTSAQPSGATQQPIPSGTPRPRPTLSPDQLPHVDAALEALLPTQIGEVPLMHASAPGRDYSGGGDICSVVCPEEPRIMAEAVGATVDDVTLAFAVDPSVERYMLVAWRVAGATGAELRDARIGLFDSEPPYPLIKDFPVAGRVVTVGIRSWFSNDTHFLVVRGEALIVIRYPTDMHDGGDVTLPDDVAEIVAALP